MNSHIDPIALLYVEMALSEAEQKQADAHLASCAACRKLVDQVSADMQLLATDKVRDLNPFMASRVQAAFESEIKLVDAPLSARWSVVYSVAVGIVFFVGVWFASSVVFVADEPIQQDYAQEFYLDNLNDEYIESMLLTQNEE